VKAIIFNADDFGASAQTNRAILRAHREGVLTSASLMVNEPAAREAAEIAQAHPSLAVGLHLTLSGGVSALPPESIPHLVNAGGRFRTNPTRAGLVCFFSRAARREAVREIEAQFARFVSFGLRLSHVDGHQHLHLHPVIWDTLLRCGEALGVRCVRIPYEEFLPATRERLAARRIEWLYFRALRRRCLRKMAGRGFIVADRVYGHLETGRMNAQYVVDLLGRLGGRTNEIYLHPGTPHAKPLPDGPPGMDVELDALLSPRVQRCLEERSIRLTTYAALAAQ
jgi:hopanoid biosynthesis associated protein HpnK